ncbi:hypothetical protein WMY93_001647 [Mugilogobius chulae]|uniref:ORM1-like protein n=1 Tax=Mugilogobius chulae TaxID=88201 RepID=A0AAW0PRB6_9GOBI
MGGAEPDETNSGAKLLSARRSHVYFRSLFQSALITALNHILLHLNAFYGGDERGAWHTASVPLVWTLTNVIHNLGMYVFMHAVKGTPFETPDQGKARLLTHWEQLDYGIQFTSSRKFFTISPIVLYFLASFYTKYDSTHFIINTASLLSVLIPKLPQLHGVRILGINKY